MKTERVTLVLALAMLHVLSNRAGADSSAPASGSPPSARQGVAAPLLHIASLRQLASRDADRITAGEAEPNPEPNLGELLPVPWEGTAGVLPEVPRAVARPENAQAFQYSHHLDVSFKGGIQGIGFPADCHIAAGRSDVITVFNSYLYVYDKRGTQRLATTLTEVMQPPSGWTVPFDPKIRYDWVNDRFFLLALTRHPSLPLSEFELAVSKTGDPTQGWTLYHIRNESGGRGVDYPELGIGARGVYLTGNYIQFSGWPSPSTSFRGTEWVFDKSALLAGQSAGFWFYEDMRGPSNEPVGTIKPASWPLQPYSGIDGFSLGLGLGPISGTRLVLVYGWSLPQAFPNQAPSYSLTSKVTQDSPAVPNARQLGGPGTMMTNNAGSSWLGASFGAARLFASMPVGSGSRCAARSYVFDVSGWPAVSIERMEDFTDATADHYWPNTAGNAYGEQGVIMSRSSPSEYVGTIWSLRQSDGSYPGEFVLHAGDAYNGFPSDTPASSYRWGDYSGIDPDPIDQGFWFYDCYATTYQNNPVFGTWIGHQRRAEFVDGGWAGAQLGTWNQPWRTIQPAADNARSNNDLVIRTGVYPVPTAITINKQLDVIADGGPVQIGP